MWDDHEVMLLDVFAENDSCRLSTCRENMQLGSLVTEVLACWKQDPLGF